MKKYLQLLPLIALLFVLTSCAETNMRMDLEPVLQCADLDESESNLINTYDVQWGTIRQITVWEPAPNGEGVSNPDKAVSHTVWVILPDGQPDMIYEPCNLPVTQMIENRRVTFTGQAFNESPYTSGLEGFTPFQIIEIMDGEEGPEGEDHSVISC